MTEPSCDVDVSTNESSEICGVDGFVMKKVNTNAPRSATIPKAATYDTLRV
jgi:hypothetical protein